MPVQVWPAGTVAVSGYRTVWFVADHVDPGTKLAEDNTYVIGRSSSFVVAFRTRNILGDGHLHRVSKMSPIPKDRIPAHLSPSRGRTVCIDLRHCQH